MGYSRATRSWLLGQSYSAGAPSSGGRVLVRDKTSRATAESASQLCSIGAGPESAATFASTRRINDRASNGLFKKRLETILQERLPLGIAQVLSNADQARGRCL